MEERESDRKFKAILENDGLRLQWVTVLDVWFHLPSDYVRPKQTAPSSVPGAAAAAAAASSA
ncbi:hypothetical protein PUNSTDRAFT_49451 [Punctularia strigosozonata HHB-11173 SS5]|uniref:uncharacterized protein n=1 Tax=Punctularia strigosozonata (strain HHB-11173) TaxID=741275 RepID=UPI00044184B8|nr:uncharacterized protein PUNSTDRAFT_49451 [Punctularia strigosozonata HHB-11173 SS5]EIN12141.1 hypothetical protein PUNSTDRAFT_49451 [Punctularia strigosozonata HHB-11173 SS5]